MWIVFVLLYLMIGYLIVLFDYHILYKNFNICLLHLFEWEEWDVDDKLYIMFGILLWWLYLFIGAIRLIFYLICSSFVACNFEKLFNILYFMVTFKRIKEKV